MLISKNCLTENLFEFTLTKWQPKIIKREKGKNILLKFFNLLRQTCLSSISHNNVTLQIETESGDNTMTTFKHFYKKKEVLDFWSCKLCFKMGNNYISSLMINYFSQPKPGTNLLSSDSLNKRSSSCLVCGFCRKESLCKSDSYPVCICTLGLHISNIQAFSDKKTVAISQTSEFLLK